jgi:hypothetical protein
LHSRPAAVADKASPKSSGKTRPLLVARANMPALAFALNEYFGGAIASNTAEIIITRGNNEDSPPPLWDPEPLGIESSPCEAVPQSVHFTDEPSEIAAVIG